MHHFLDKYLDFTSNLSVMLALAAWFAFYFGYASKSKYHKAFSIITGILIVFVILIPLLFGMFGIY
jgi:hypothetical protein